METSDGKLKDWKEEILKTELEFADMAAKDGLQKAFLHFAAEDAVLMRNNSLVEGKGKIEDYFNERSTDGVKLSWKPDFVDVSQSGDLGYTYGKYELAYKDENGELITNTGVFHTVWKRQPDGSWRFVWD